MKINAKTDKGGAVLLNKVSGCGMDMGFHLVYSLAHVLFSGDTASEDAGYSLTHRWL